MADHPSITLRTASISDQPLLEYWDTQPHVIASDPDDDWNWAEELKHFPDWREQLVAELDGRPIGFIQIIDPAEEESHYWGNIPAHQRAIDIWIGEADDLGKGYGTEMMRLALHSCFAPPEVTAVLIDPLESNTAAIRFYQRLGFTFVEHRQFGTSRCAVHRMSREVWEQQSW